MTNPDDPEELTTEDEVDEVPYVEFDISVSPSDPSLELLAQQIERQDIIIPFYQRKFVWKIEQASKLIESFLMGLPVPQIFLYVNSDDQLEVIDGQQRLMSVKYFMEGYFGDVDAKGKRQVFKLKGLAERSEFNGKTFADLPAKDQRRFRNSTLRAINIKQLKPSLRNDSVFHIFERLNTGGTQLKPQEIRNAVYRGSIVSKLTALNENPNWRSILGQTLPDKNQKDIELLLRLFALFEVWSEYEKPMLRYLNRFMDRERDFSSEQAKRFTTRFQAVTALVAGSLNRPFRPRGVINAAVLEAVMISLLESPQIDSAALKARYPILLADNAFLKVTTGATTDTLVLKDRLRIAREVLTNGAV
ncbi:DUF262 domain-containing protein [Roseococcus suduntuyensis]|uniref:GmrSD restriction endonucleases N-terminal domain-containing protein n=1 Tax=Roseococcus suduntuyensis TaxID=455361 RepID=A0A840AIH6_9PROT|nr:DUF262 domain-containing protein [Roseococcus suduntuyensis]MBB3900413.1 hypothetical protein [Roseococcus suduntuyensis]